MRRDRLFRSTAFRLALVFTVMTVGTFLATGIVVFEFVNLDLRQRQDQTIRQTYAVIRNAYGDSDLTDLLDVVDTNVRATRNHERVFLVTGPNGKALGGNISPNAFPDGWSDAGAHRLGLEGDARYRLYAGNVVDKRLIVGASHEEVDRLGDIMLAGFGWALLVVVALATAGGALIAHRAQRRLDAVRDTMDSVARGDLAARIALSRRNDDLDHLSRDINDALARLATTVEGMRQVSADIAHDLKTPLNRLKITIENALGQHEAGETVKRDLEAAADEADAINQTFEALLRIAQIESGARKARFAHVDLRELFSSVADIYTEVAADSGHCLAASLDARGAVVTGDRELLTQMVVNLIENAIRHCPKGTRIAIGVRVEGGEIRTWIEDDGPGIPESEREHVFRRLYRLEKSRTTPGTGLGLNLVKAVADLHDATIRIEDARPGLRLVVGFARIPDGGFRT